MATKDDGKLFHAIVLMGVALTGGVANGACGGTTGTGSGDAAAEDAADGSYAQIGYNGDASIVPPDGYPQIAFDASVRDNNTADAPTDAGADCYPCIAPNS